MNPGILSVIQYVITVVLLLTGWWTQLLQALNIRCGTLTGWLTLFIVVSQVDIPLTHKLNVNAGFVFIVAAAVFSWRKTDTDQRLMLFSTIALTASSCYFIREMSVIDPALLLLPAPWLQVGVVLLLAGMSVKGVWERTALVTGGLTAGYALSVFRHLHQLTVWSFGTPAFFDLFWSCLIGLLVIENMSRGLTWGPSLRRRIHAKKSGETNG